MTKNVALAVAVLFAVAPRIGAAGTGGAVRQGVAFRLEVRATTGDEPPVDLAAARRLTRLGRAYQEGDGVARDLARAIDLFGAACAAEYGPACTYLGVRHHLGIGLPADDAAAARFLERACALGDGGGCAMRAMLEERAARATAPAEATAQTPIAARRAVPTAAPIAGGCTAEGVMATAVESAYGSRP